MGERAARPRPTRCEEINMIQKVKAKIIGASGSDALAVEWLRENPSEGSVSIGGPLVTHLPLSLVSSELRLPNTLVSVSLSDPYTVVCVEPCVTSS